MRVTTRYVHPLEEQGTASLQQSQAGFMPDQFGQRPGDFQQMALTDLFPQFGADNMSWFDS